MLHEEDPDALGGELVDDGAQVVGLGGVQTADRLVEEQYLGRRTQSPAQLDEPQDARRQVAGQTVGTPAQSEPLESAVDGRRHIAIGAPAAREQAAHDPAPTADGLSRKWGKPTVVENIAGGSMNIGAGQVARAAPDGYTLFVAPPAPLALAHLVNKINYNPLDWVPITLLAKIANVLSVRNTLPVNTLQELIAYGRANPGKLSYATQGANSTAHLTGAYLEAQTGIKMVAIAYRGAQPALTDILAGNIDMFFDTLATSVPLHRAGKLKILLQMSLVLVQGAKRRVIRVGRIAGQYAKPRSVETETREGVTLPSYRGDLINRFTISAAINVVSDGEQCLRRARRRLCALPSDD